MAGLLEISTKGSFHEENTRVSTRKMKNLHYNPINSDLVLGHCKKNNILLYQYTLFYKGFHL